MTAQGNAPMPRNHAIYALLAAALFGLSTPFAKLLLGPVGPWVLAGIFYSASGVGLGALIWIRQRLGAIREKPLSWAEVPWLAGAILCGGVVGPILLMIGLTTTPASTASLLLTMEGVATALIAWFIFRENFDARIMAGMILIVCGAAALAIGDRLVWSGIVGPLTILGACLAWGIDNNLTRKVSLADPLQIAMLKGLVAGPVTLFLAYLSKATVPAVTVALAAGIVGFIGYGLSLALFVLALRHLGTARTGAYFSTAPFIGAAAAIPLLGEHLSVQLIGAGILMAIGVWLHLTERHEHQHQHRPLEHTHKHTHDAHHAHSNTDHGTQAHTHQHVHTEMKHSHPHTPDTHHHHGH